MNKIRPKLVSSELCPSNQLKILCLFLHPLHALQSTKQYPKLLLQVQLDANGLVVLGYYFSGSGRGSSHSMRSERVSRRIVLRKRDNGQS